MLYASLADATDRIRLIGERVIPALRSN